MGSFGSQHGYYTDTGTGLLCLTHRYYDPGTGKFVNRDPIGYAGGENLYGFADGNPVNESDPDGFAPKRGTHHANVRVTENGQVGPKTRYVSGNMTPEEKALGFPQNSLATHTEARAMNDLRLSPGQTIRIVGHYAPCTSCKGKMNAAVRASNGQGSVIYKWRANGNTNTWTANGGKNYKASVLDKLGDLGDRLKGLGGALEVFNFAHIYAEQYGYMQYGNGSWSENRFMAWLKIWHPEEYKYREDNWMKWHG